MKGKSKIKGKFDFWLLSFHKEIMKTSAIGKKMLVASRTNAHLKDTYAELGKHLVRGVDCGEVEWDSPKMRSMIHTVKACRNDLQEIENKMNVIKFQSLGHKSDEEQNLKD